MASINAIGWSDWCNYAINDSTQAFRAQPADYNAALTNTHTTGNHDSGCRCRRCLPPALTHHLQPGKV